MKLKELLGNRKKLEKYDELERWKDRFGQSCTKIGNYSVSSTGISCGTTIFDIPDHIREIIVAAFDAEIAKLDDE